MRKSILLWIVLIPFISLAQFQQVGQTLEGLGLNEGYTTDLFGQNVAISGDGATMAVAAIGADMMVKDEFYNHSIHYVQIFRMTNGEWQQIGETIQGVYDPELDSYSRVGKSLAFSEDGNTLVIGETHYRETLPDGTYLAGGRVRVFKFEDGDWIQNGNDIVKDDIGEYVDINQDGKVIAIGNPYHSIDNQPQFGFVETYQIINGQWVLKGDTIYGENPFTFLGYGVSLSGDGNRLAVGDGDSPMMILQSNVRIYDFTNNDWTLTETLSREYLPEEISPISISLSGNGKRLAIGNSGTPELFFPTGPDSHYGHITLFEENEENEWEQIGAIDGEYFEFIGYSVDLSWDGKILASSPYIGNENKIFKETDGEWNHIGSVIKGIEDDWNTWGMPNSRDGSVVALGNSLVGFHGEASAYQDCDLSEIDVSPGEGSNVCKGSTTVLTAGILPEFYAAAGSVRWYDSEEAVTPIFIGSEFETPPIMEDTVFWVEAATAGGCASVRQPIEVTLYPTPNLELDNEEVGICEGSTAVLTVSTDGVLINWYESENATDPIFTGIEFETPELYENTSYWVEAVSDEGCLSERIEVSVLVSEIPELTVENTDIEVCEGSSVVLTASASIGDINWYESETSVDPVFTGTTFETPVLTDTTSYWVEAVNEYCVSERIEITVTVNPLPELEIESTEVDVCLGSDAYMYAYSEGNVIFWYAEEDDTEYLYHGNNFIAEGLTETTVFWVEAYNINTDCVSERVPVTVTVIPAADITAEETEFEICSGNTATLTATSSSTVYWYDSADGIDPIFTGEVFTTPVLHTSAQYWAEASGEGECVSERIKFTVDVSAAVEAPEGVQVQPYFTGMTLADFVIDHTGTLRWYADEELTVELPETTVVEIATFYYVTQTIGGCESPAFPVMADEFLNNGGAMEEDFTYYPNPVKDRLYFKGSETISSLEVYDVNGRLIKTENAKTGPIESIDTRFLTPGVYIIKAVTDKAVKTFKVIKR